MFFFSHIPLYLCRNVKSVMLKIGILAKEIASIRQQHPSPRQRLSALEDLALQSRGIVFGDATEYADDGLVSWAESEELHALEVRRNKFVVQCGVGPHLRVDEIQDLRSVKKVHAALCSDI
jgi:hypothetical protein